MSAARLAEIPIVFYRTSGGAEPVLEWLRSLPAAAVLYLALWRMKGMQA